VLCVWVVFPAHVTVILPSQQLRLTDTMEGPLLHMSKTCLIWVLPKNVQSPSGAPIMYTATKKLLWQPYGNEQLYSKRKIRHKFIKLSFLILTERTQLDTDTPSLNAFKGRLDKFWDKLLSVLCRSRDIFKTVIRPTDQPKGQPGL